MDGAEAKIGGARRFVARALLTDDAARGLRRANKRAPARAPPAAPPKPTLLAAGLRRPTRVRVDEVLEDKLDASPPETAAGSCLEPLRHCAAAQSLYAAAAPPSRCGCTASSCAVAAAIRARIRNQPHCVSARRASSRRRGNGTGRSSCGEVLNCEPSSGTMVVRRAAEGADGRAPPPQPRREARPPPRPRAPPPLPPHPHPHAPAPSTHGKVSRAAGAAR